jgi:hypothetical protein
MAAVDSSTIDAVLRGLAWAGFTFPYPPLADYRPPYPPCVLTAAGIRETYGPHVRVTVH